MVNTNPSTATLSPVTESGIYIRGVVISNSARKITKKDGGILALVKHELALEPGLAVLEQFLDPKENPHIVIEGNEVTKFPELKKFESIIVKVLKFRDVNGQLSTTSWEQV